MPGRARSRADEEVARAAQARGKARHDRFALRHGGDAGALHEALRARGVVLDQLADAGDERRRRDQPAEPPAGHQPVLGERVGADHPVLGRREVQERRGDAGAGRAVVEPLVGIVGHDPDPVPAAVREQRVLRRAVDRPAGRVVRRVDVERARARRERREQAVEVERPAARTERERHAVDRRAEDLRDLDQVRPQRRHFHHPVARADDRLRREHQRRHARVGHRDALDVHRPVQPRHVGGERLAERRDPEVVGVEGVPGLERLDRRRADEVGRDLVRLAEPERQDVGVAEAGVRHLADLRAAERLDGGAGGGHRGDSRTGARGARRRRRMARSRTGPTGHAGSRGQSGSRDARRAPARRRLASARGRGRRARADRRARRRQGVDPSRGTRGARRARGRARAPRARRSAALRHPVRGQGQHRRRRPADDRGLSGRSRTRRRSRRRWCRRSSTPARSRSGRRTSTSSRPGSSARARRTARARTRSMRATSPAARAPAPRWRLQRGSSASRSAPIPPVRGACRRRSTTSSGSSRRRASSARAAWCPPAGRSIACRSSR